MLRDKHASSHRWAGAARLQRLPALQGARQSGLLLAGVLFLLSTVVLATTSAASAASGGSISIPKGAAVPPPGYAGSSTALDGWSPLVATVIIGTNNTVTWTNEDVAAHTVTIHSPTNGSVIADSGNLAPDAAYSCTFTASGTYKITCDYHPWMIGTVIVQGQGHAVP